MSDGIELQLAAVAALRAENARLRGLAAGLVVLIGAVVATRIARTLTRAAA